MAVATLLPSTAVAASPSAVVGDRRRRGRRAGDRSHGSRVARSTSRRGGAAATACAVTVDGDPLLPQRGADGPLPRVRRRAATVRRERRAVRRTRRSPRRAQTCSSSLRLYDGTSYTGNVLSVAIQWTVPEPRQLRLRQPHVELQDRRLRRRLLLRGVRGRQRLRRCDVGRWLGVVDGRLEQHPVVALHLLTAVATSGNAARSCRTSLSGRTHGRAGRDSHGDADVAVTATSRLELRVGRRTRRAARARRCDGSSRPRAIGLVEDAGVAITEVVRAARQLVGHPASSVRGSTTPHARLRVEVVDGGGDIDTSRLAVLTALSEPVGRGDRPGRLDRVVRDAPS